MSQKYIVDACIWRDFYEDRISLVGRPLGSYAYEFFVKILKKKNVILFSKVLIIELRLRYSHEEIDELLNLLGHMGKLSRIEITEEEDVEARELALKRKIPYNDCLNAIHARNHGAVLISQDKHVIHALSDICESSRPEKVS
ncbi:MAG: PIN domain-containing protein [archaeon]